MTITRSLVLTLACLIGFPFTVPAEELPPFQKLPITLSAAKTLPEDSQKGSNFQVYGIIVDNGLINTHYLETDYGKLIK